jgi:hypothetical protein
MKNYILGIGFLVGQLALSNNDNSNLQIRIMNLSKVSKTEAIKDLNSIEEELKDSINQYDKNKISSQLSLLLPELLNLHAQLNKEADKISSKQKKLKLEDCELKDRVEALNLWVISQLKNDVFLKVLASGSDTAQLASLLHFLSRQCEQNLTGCSPELITKTSANYKALAGVTVRKTPEVLGGFLILDFLVI